MVKLEDTLTTKFAKSVMEGVSYYPDDYSGRYSDPGPPQEIKKECEHLIPADKFRIEVSCTLCGVKLKAEWKPIE